MQRIGEMACIVCDLLGREQESRTEVHHLRDGVGMQQRSSSFLTIPVCSDDHRGPQGIHGDRTYLRMLKMGEMELLAATLERILK